MLLIRRTGERAVGGGGGGMKELWSSVGAKKNIRC